MTEFERHIEFYSRDYPHQHFSRLVPEEKWGDKKLAKRYLQKYWLPEQEYLSIWKPIQDKIFIQGKSLPDLIFRPGFEMTVANGGLLFTERDFKQLQRAMQDIGEKYFVVIQSGQNYTNGEPMFKMKYPVNITWQELSNGNYISAVLLDMSFNEYYVFGASGSWGKFVATDYIRSLDIIGFKSELSPLFKKIFKISKRHYKHLKKWLPLAYQVLMD